jgi:hypothetical protein
LNVLPWLASSQASDVSYGLTHGVTGDVSSALVGLGDGASFGLTSTLTQALYPEADCEIRSNSGFYYSGEIAGAIGSTVATAGIGGAGEGAAATEEAADGAADAGEYLYRGVHSTHPGFADAQQGIAVPRGGPATAYEHNALNDTQSEFTSWSTSRDVAEGFRDGSGVILRIDRAAISSSRLVESPDIYDELEVLVRGAITGATVLR